MSAVWAMRASAVRVALSSRTRWPRVAPSRPRKERARMRKAYGSPKAVGWPAGVRLPEEGGAGVRVRVSGG
ncbi:hypothetical protein GCM10020254_25610 [Streptomyces goshikiensis]